jgi:acetamidase/formamidase
LLFTVDRTTALALASPTVDLRVTQVANDVWGVHAVLPHGVLR